MQKREFYDTIYYHFSRVGKALTSPKRMELLDLLTQGPKTVEMLAKETEMSIANTSQHLQILLDSKLVKFRKRGTFMVYKLANTKVCDLINSLQKVTEDQLEEINQLRNEYIERPDQINSIDLDAFLVRIEEDGNFILLDVRPTSEYDVAHIPGALSVPYEQLNDELSKFPKDKEIIVYCRGQYCVYATDTVEILTAHGFKAIRLSAGIQHWKRKLNEIAKST
ncbi:metalloregulator ArsR/SmtB family transcription factor [Bacillus sp. FJAT-49705]|uniref:Metalloregulator ArsR/SmtB family transcription factor n=1 Tax=Cytobacillus citreus TaxID=2833586 RepID=A0ABS5NPI5_9BACI|nr:metalloregulator ArsR/SmtB family transcription factor [Cytobacillus citreus]MBS4189486.1 metalloregulator ArsR/SmtB family transcription factor [Cytobacillus citreus]